MFSFCGVYRMLKALRRLSVCRRAQLRLYTLCRWQSFSPLSFHMPLATANTPQTSKLHTSSCHSLSLLECQEKCESQAKNLSRVWDTVVVHFDREVCFQVSFLPLVRKLQKDSDKGKQVKRRVHLCHHVCWRQNLSFCPFRNPMPFSGKTCTRYGLGLSHLNNGNFNGFRLQ